MSDMKCYVTAEEGRQFSINYDYKQVFHHKMKMGIAEYVVIKEFSSKDDLTRKMSLEIMVFLRDFCFATEEQLAELLQMKGFDPSKLPGLLRTYVNSRCLNYFTLAQYDMDEIPEDAFKVYCLDHGGVSILTHFSSTDCVSWLSTDCVRGPELVVKYLNTNQFYLELLKARGEDLRFFKPLHTVTIGRRDMRFSAEFQIMQGYTPHTFILESVRSYDIPVAFTKKVSEQISVFMGQKYWEKYYNMPPTYIFLAENEADAKEIAEIFYRRLGYDQFRIMLDDMVRQGFDNVILYKYVPGTEEAPESRLVPVRSGMFSGVNR